MAQKRISTVWELWDYDVWGDAEEYSVNDRFCFDRSYLMCLEVQTANAGTERQFEYASPSDWKIKQIFGVNCEIETEGDDTVIYVSRASDGYPIGEMILQAPGSLSPIAAND